MLVLCQNALMRYLAIYAHPDDESFGFAGTAMRLIDAGHEVGLTTLTRGEAGRWYPKPVGGWRSADLARQRAKEWRGAVRTVGFQRSWLLRWPDGAVADVDPDRVTAQLVRIIRGFKPAVVVTFGPEGAGSEHDDHAATSRLATRAFRWAAAPGVLPGAGRPHRARRLYFGTAPEGARTLRQRRPAGYLTPTHVVDISAYVERKARAFENHRSQFKDRPFFYAMLRRRGPREYFHLAIDRDGTPRSALL